MTASMVCVEGPESIQHIQSHSIVKYINSFAITVF